MAHYRRVSVAGVKQFLLDTVTLCRKEGYVETLFGRRRYLPTIQSPNAAIRGRWTSKIAFGHLSSLISEYMQNVLKCIKASTVNVQLNLVHLMGMFYSNIPEF
jgi:hypothetical protein